MFVCVCVSNCEGGDANVLQVPYYHVLPCLSQRKGEEQIHDGFRRLHSCSLVETDGHCIIS